MTIVPLKIPNGVYRNGTDQMAEGRWHDANLVRWHEDALRPVGGWRKRSSTSTLTGVPRGMLAYSNSAGTRFIVTGTHAKLFASVANGTISEITPTSFTSGRADANNGTGFGSSTYGNYAYGTPRPDIGATSQDATTWSIEPWGQYILACSTDDGKIYQWQNNVAVIAAVVTNAPTSNRAIMVTEERFVFALGAGGDPRKVQWCDQEAETTWTPAATNQAGDQILQTTGRIMAGVRTRGQSLILTDMDAHTATYVGNPFVFSFQRVGTACGLPAAKAVAVVDQGVVWMGKRDFFVYSGGSVQQLPCEVADHVFSSINRNQISKVHAVTNSEYSEVWWFYPSDDSSECNSYVVWNYGDNNWSIGSLTRTTGVDRGVFRYPIMAGTDTYIYEHEAGFDYDSVTPFAESGAIQLATDQQMTAVELIPDEKTQGDVTVKFKTRLYPNGSETEHGSFTMANPVPVRFTGKQIRMRVEGSRLADWRVGIMKLDVRGAGRR